MRPKGSEMGQPRSRGIRHYFFLPEPKFGCQPAPFWLGAAAITLIFSFLGFLVSRLLLCSPLAMSISLNFDWLRRNCIPSVTDIRRRKRGDDQIRITSRG